MINTVKKKRSEKKRIVIPFLCLILVFLLTGCAEKEKGFSYNRDVMIQMTKDIVESYRNVTDEQAEYLLEKGKPYEQEAIRGFRQLETTDKVGKFVGFNTSEDAVRFTEGAKDNILCTITCKYEERDVEVTISYTENKLFAIQKNTVLENLAYSAAIAGYQDVDQYIKDNYSQMGLNVDDAESFADNYLYNMYAQSKSQNPVFFDMDFMEDYMYTGSGVVAPYIPDEFESTAVYSKGELLLNGAKNMGVGMGVVFLVLIFIAFIISLLKFVPRLLGREKKPEAAKQPAASDKPVLPQPPVSAGEVPAVGEEVEDGELIAVITAAIQEFEGNNAGPDGLVVRSIRRVSGRRR